MKISTLTLILTAAFWAASASAETQKFVGLIGKVPVTVMADIAVKGSVRGHFSRNDNPARRFEFSGSRQSVDTVRLRVTCEAKPVALAELRKRPSKSGTIWAGKYRLADGTILPFAFYRSNPGPSSGPAIKRK